MADLAVAYRHPVRQAAARGFGRAGGIAIGVDRMIMLFGDEPEIDYTFWL